MEDLIAALGLVLVIEGALYGLFPDGMKRMMVQALEMPTSSLRVAGAVAVAVGFLVLWLVRGG